MKKTYSQYQPNQQKSVKRPLIDKQEHNPRKVCKVQNVEAFALQKTKIYLFTDLVDSITCNTISKKLANIAQSQTKPQHVHQYRVTIQSLIKAKSLGYTQQQILGFLNKYKRNDKIPDELYKLIKNHYKNISFGCVRLYMQEDEDKNEYYLEIQYEQFQIISSQDRQFIESLTKSIIEIEENDRRILKFQIIQYEHNKISQRLFRLNIPISTEKILRKNKFQTQRHYVDILRKKSVIHCKDLKISLKAFTKLRDYQYQALRCVVEKIITQNTVEDKIGQKIVQKKEQIKVKSGYIVLPCGAGKTLLGISIMTRIKKQTLIVCSSDSGTEQWKRQIQKWTQGVHRDQMIILTSKTIDDYKWNPRQSKAYIYISTYTNLKSKFENKQNIKNQYEWIRMMPWGLIVFDQAQWLPAPGNKQIINSLLAHVKIGLTATPMREDNQIKSLIYMIGPQLYVGNWKAFVQHGYLANPKCLQIRTKMTEKFQQYYQQSKSDKQKRQICYQINPNKIKALIYLLKHHESLNDNIIVFCDKVDLVVYLAKKLQKPLLSGEADVEERNFVFDKFRQGIFKTIFLTRIGDEAIDLPNANVAIQLNIHKGSRKQMLQRLGRIMRPKQASSSESYNAIFYTIVSDQTLQMKYFMKRHKCLVDLGFQYDLRLFDYKLKGDLPQLMKNDPEGQKQMLQVFKNIIPDEEKYWLDFKSDEV